MRRLLLFGRRTSLTRGNGTSTSYSYDNGSRLSQLVQDIAGTSHDLTLGFSYNPAGQIVSNTRSNDAYAWTGHGSGVMESPANGLNQLSSVGGAAVTHDAKGNLTYDPTNGYGYDYSIENLLTRVNAPTWSRRLYYDPLMRLYQPASVLFAYDGENRIAEYHADGSGQTNRFVHGPEADEPLVEYGGTGLATRHFLHADERGSIIAASDSSGNPMGISRYDEYGRNQNFVSRFVFAGQPYESASQLNYARARMYNQRLGRFMQPDPIKYDDGMNMYAYVKADPVNRRDPSGTTSCNTAATRICERTDLAEAANRFVEQHYGDWSGAAKAALASSVLSYLNYGASLGEVKATRNIIASSQSLFDAPRASAGEMFHLAGDPWGPDKDWFQLTDERYAHILRQHALRAAINFATSQNVAKGVLSPTLWDWQDMRNAIMYVVNASPAYPGSGNRSVYEAQLPYLAGFSRNGLLTRWLTVITEPTFGVPGSNDIVTIYPGRRTDPAGR